MMNQPQIYDSETYCENGRLKRENLKANSSGRPGTSHDSRSSFFKIPLPPVDFLRLQNIGPLVNFVAEPAEIPIFRFPEAPHRARASYRRAIVQPPFFNST
ncbi:hypothetical protein JRG66_06970 [Salinimicrobium tongyeongense]|uniref:Uncharacterized protein n=1 Tax=Salinimicrobium tongyeongense TaxID=2809707 RepID=A0ABY6NUJ6_9FLAO|nr:hypothetical protein [Salinimicrobium tongyeongense]UZH56587.1 hypothetical protein JRG66_06970 [Salinimicrobium tongyeongense]